MSYTHISAEDLNCLSRMLRAGYSFKEIAETLNKDPSTISKHVNSNGGRDKYNVKEVKRKKKQLRILAMESSRRIKGKVLTQITKQIKRHKSPEQIAGRLNKISKKVIVSSNTIYRYIKERAPHLKQYLRQSKKTTRRKRGTNIRAQDRYTLAKKRRIDERPAIVERRGRIGDFEGDTIMGKDKRVRIVTLVDRRSGYLIAFLLPKFNSELLAEMLINKLKHIPLKKRKTITFDNGVEFSDWERIEERSKTIVYFCYPYHSWERGTNENTNGLLRDFYPKKYDFNLITEDELKDVVKLINTRERKRLQFRTPKEVFWKK